MSSHLKAVFCTDFFIGTFYCMILSCCCVMFPLGKGVGVWYFETPFAQLCHRVTELVTRWSPGPLLHWGAETREQWRAPQQIEGMGKVIETALVAMHPFPAKPRCTGGERNSGIFLRILINLLHQWCLFKHLSCWFWKFL